MGALMLCILQVSGSYLGTEIPMLTEDFNFVYLIPSIEILTSISHRIHHS
jgi:hypothetical protein